MKTKLQRLFLRQLSKEKTRIAEAATREMKEVGRLGQNLVVMELSS